MVGRRQCGWRVLWWAASPARHYPGAREPSDCSIRDVVLLEPWDVRRRRRRRVPDCSSRRASGSSSERLWTLEVTRGLGEPPCPPSGRLGSTRVTLPRGRLARLPLDSSRWNVRAPERERTSLGRRDEARTGIGRGNLGWGKFGQARWSGIRIAAWHQPARQSASREGC